MPGKFTTRFWSLFKQHSELSTVQSTFSLASSLSLVLFLRALCVSLLQVQLIVEAQSSAMQAGRGGVLVHSSVNHVAHLAGALMGVLLMWLVSRIPDPDSQSPAARRS